MSTAGTLDEHLTGVPTETLGEDSIWPQQSQPGGHVGRYRIGTKRGAGAMGTVYEAWDEQLCRNVAIKVLHPSRAGRAQDRRRVRREARAMATVSHPSVVPVYDVGEHDGGLFVVMELVDAPSLAHWLRSPRTLEERWEVLRTSAQGLLAAHRAGVIHRDVKPANILVSPRGVGRVTDFGLAVGTALVTADESVSWMVGTPAYMAPEQHDGLSVDARADQFAFCVTAWEVLTGRRPFEAKGVWALAQAKLERRPQGVNTAGVPRRMLRVLERGMAPAPQDRWPDLEALLVAMEGRSWGRMAKFGAVGAVALTLGFIGAPEDRCGPGLAIMQDAWSAPRRNGLEAQLAEDLGRTRARGVMEDLDARVDEWSQAYEKTCRAQDVPMAEQVDPRRRCLARVRRQHLAWIDVAEQSARRGLEALASLDRASDCARVDGDPLKVDDPRRYEEIDAAISEGWSHRVQGRFEEAESRLAEAVALAHEAGHLEQRVYALFRLASVQDTRGRPLDAVVTLQRAAEAAQELQSDKRSAEIWIELTWVHHQLGELDDAERSYRSAKAAIERMGGNHRFEAGLLTNLAAIHHARGRNTEGVQALQDALVLWDKEVERPYLRDRAVASIENNLAAFAFQRGDPREAVELLHLAQNRLERLFGAMHPEVADYHLDLSATYDAMGDMVAARKHVEEGRRVLRLQLEADHPSLARAEELLSYVAYGEGDERKAAEHLGLAAQMRMRRFGERDQVAWSYEVNRARMLFDLGEHEQAHALVQQAKAAVGDIDPPTPRTFATLLSAGELGMWTGHKELAVADFERALEMLPLVHAPDTPPRLQALEIIAETLDEAGYRERAAEVMAMIPVAQRSSMRSGASGEME